MHRETFFTKIAREIKKFYAVFGDLKIDASFLVSHKHVVSVDIKNIQYKYILKKENLRK